MSKPRGALKLSALEELRDNPEYYGRESVDFELDVDGKKFKPSMYRLKPKGLEILAEHYREKYGVDIRVSTTHRTIIDYFTEKAEEIIKEFEGAPEGKKIGLILSNNLPHVVPIVISRDKSDNKITVMSFDSVGDPIGYGRLSPSLANKNFKFFLNEGVRQRDGISCTTDSILILKDALRIENLVETVKSKMSDGSTVDKSILEMLRTSKFPLPEKLFFSMPEDLLKTAQRKTFITNVKPNMSRLLTTTKGGGKTLTEKMAQHRVTLEGYREPTNLYLVEKSYKFARIICDRLERTSSPSVAAAGAAAVAATDISHSPAK